MHSDQTVIIIRTGTTSYGLHASKNPSRAEFFVAHPSRDKITRHINMCFDAPGPQGLMIKGPQGIGKSLNLTLHDIGMQRKGVESQLNMERAINIIKLVADLLKKHGVKWVCICDQVNSLFARFSNIAG